MSEQVSVVASQGDEMSYHGLAARELFGPHVSIMDCGDFGGVIHETRQETPQGMGIIAVKTAQGAVKQAVAEVVQTVPDALSPVTGRVDLEVAFLLVSPQELGLEDVTRPNWTHRVHVHAHPEAWRQSEAVVRELLDRPKYMGSSDNIQAVRTAKKLNQRFELAICPVHAVEDLDVHPIVDRRLNPPNSFTRFYGLQLNPDLPLIVPNPTKTDRRTVVSITHPEQRGAMDKVLQLFEGMELVPMDFIGFPPRDTRISAKMMSEFLRRSQDHGWVPSGLGFSMDEPSPTGGIFEINCDRRAFNLAEFCARVSRIRDAQGERGSFMTRILGTLDWKHEDPMDLDKFADRYEARPDPERPLVVRGEDKQPEDEEPSSEPPELAVRS